MKHLIMILALMLAGCSTAQIERPLYWNPPSQPWTEEKSNVDKRRCQQLGESIDPRLGGDAGGIYQRCMIRLGYQMVYIKGE
jgi:hypothetical protein